MISLDDHLVRVVLHDGLLPCLEAYLVALDHGLLQEVFGALIVCLSAFLNKIGSHVIVDVEEVMRILARVF